MPREDSYPSLLPAELKQLISLGNYIGPQSVGRVARNGYAVVAAATPLLWLEDNPKRIWATVVNNGANDCMVHFGEQGNALYGLLLRTGGSMTVDIEHPWTGAIYAFSTLGTTLSYEEMSVA
jgi:hypothetical protein